ncbi:MAG: hypothetical protein ACREXM_05065 [Gammaproteobacteria bacterium]
MGNLARQLQDNSISVSHSSANKHELSLEQKEDLKKSILDFLSWLRKIKKLKAEAAYKYEALLFPDPTVEDWIMQVRGSTVSFNTHILDKCSYDYYRMIVVHECFHLFVQDLPNKSDAKRLRDDFGEVIMKLLDIEADYYTAMYFREEKYVPLVNIFTLTYEGSKIFGDPKIRATKLERFLGSVPSIANAYFKNPRWKPTKDNDLYLPDINNIMIEDRMHILISRKNHFMVSDVRLDVQDFIKLRNCYTKIDDISVREYVETLLCFASRVLGLPIQDETSRLLFKIKN